jgi:hypothetical protein
MAMATKFLIASLLLSLLVLHFAEADHDPVVFNCLFFFFSMFTRSFSFPVAHVRKVLISFHLNNMLFDI